MKKIFIIAGEASGDYLGGCLIEDIKKIIFDPKYIDTKESKIEFIGVGGTNLEKAGLKLIFSIDELSIIGIWEVIGKIFHVKKLIKKTVDAVHFHKPDVVVTIDSSGFTHRIDKALKKSEHSKHIPIVHYVAPPVWAWRSWRAKSLHKFIDKLLVLLPFEPEIFTKHHLKTVFVGHPIASDVNFNTPTDIEKAAFLQKIGISKDSTSGVKIVTLLPGSRKSEIDAHIPIMSKFSEMMTEKYKDVKFIIPTIETMKGYVESKTANWLAHPLVVGTVFEKNLTYHVSDVSVAASGTVTLELAKTGVPSVVIYKTSALTAAIVKYLIKIKYVCLINIIAKKEIVPELLQKQCTAENIFENVVRLLETRDGEEQKQSSSNVIESLKPRQSTSAALEVLKIFDKK